ncbi:UDP-N-acetylenolpyruvoylglucosamine reductase 1 [Candidatus Moduliflexus flocculans]|uniref:UDP-N-acetylenolpyruvoylglucosamine reductase n=1 Tax=Candidatus Moduliflexus flocculans TaxID=1499966 RepID=A0A0S6VZ04_9BACT|nr:UDP-N-acetylenolpyruvoylglucosamine reductase 1 [Candidatus Moduliflexus flocculans]
MREIQKDISLRQLTTFKIGGPARYFTEAQSFAEIEQAWQFAREHRLNTLILGGGSNMLVSDAGFDGLVIKINLTGMTIQAEDEQTILLNAAAGECWDDVTARCVESGWWGIENLSLIPGSAGALAVQNVGAYGQEASEVIESLDVCDLADGRRFQMTTQQCGFGYRVSMFNTTCPGRYLILSVTLRLKKRGEANLSYRDLAAYFEGKKSPTLTDIREAVIAIRNAKLPDPAIIGNAGSFFKNLTLDLAAFQRMLAHVRRQRGNETAAVIETRCRISGNQVKVPTALLLDVCGLKGLKIGGAALYDKHPLILINATGNATADEVMSLMKTVRQTVYAHTGLEIMPEPNFIGFTQEELECYFAL